MEKEYEKMGNCCKCAKVSCFIGCRRPGLFSHLPSPISRWFPFAGILGARFLGGNNGARALQEQSNLQRAAPGVIFRTSQSDMWPCSLGILALLCSTLNCSCGTSCCTACNDVDVDVGGTFIIETLEPAGKKAKNPTQVPELRAH